MTLDLQAIGVLAAAALLYALLPTASTRRWFLFGGSVLGIYWLQPALRLRYADFLFPTLTLGLTVATWWRTQPAPPAGGDPHRPTNRRAALLLPLLVIGLAVFRYVDPAWRLTAGRPPAPLWVAAGLAAAVGIYLAVARLERRLPLRTVLAAGSGLLVLLLILLKTEPLAATVSAAWRSAAGQDVSLAAGLDLGWLGFSYVAFRLIHTIRERQLGRLPGINLRDYVTYVVFPPAYIAGPIDRVERFGADLDALADGRGLPAGDVVDGLTRIAGGLLKKFVIADTLALGLALTPDNVLQATSPAGLWLLLYGYALRLYFDFGGYTDIAIGLGLLFGVRLPENFRRPYLRSDLATFWQSWHATLSSWVRFYVFTPLSRALLRRKPRPSPTLILLLAHTATMLVIGLWHGVAWHFAVWGLWHAAGLFVHKQWSDRTRRWYRRLQAHPWRRRAWGVAGWGLTFHFVVVGWVWFLIPDLALAGRTLLRLAGIGW